MFSKRRNDPICRNGYARRVFLLCSRTDPLHSRHHSYQRHLSFHLRRVIPTVLHPYKQGGWGGRPLALHGRDIEPASVPYREHSRRRWVTPGHKTECTWETSGKAVVIETPMAFVQAARPWEAGGNRRIALAATCEGEHGLVCERRALESAQTFHCPCLPVRTLERAR
jgi:hypothetical protein